MTTSTLGTNANSSIPYAMAFQPTNPIADFATLQGAMYDDGASPVGGPAATRVAFPGAPGKMGWSTTGLLFIPNRGVLRALPGDWVGVTTRGWPILLSADEIANGLWTHSP